MEGEKAKEEENPLGYLHLLKISKNAHTHPWMSAKEEKPGVTGIELPLLTQ